MAELGSMAEPLLRAAAAHPDRVAVVHGQDRRTYAQVVAAVHRLAAALWQVGVRPGDRVASLLPNGPELIEVYYALQHLGVAVVPLNVRSIAREVEHLVRASAARALIFDPACGAQAAAAGATLLSVGPSAVPGARDLTAVPVAAPPPVVRDPDAVSRIQYTGGSTGCPKGVERTHAADLVEIEGILGSNGLADDEAKVVLIGCPMDHHGGHSWFTMAVAVAATVVVQTCFDPQAILEQIERHRVSYLILLPPSTYVRLMAHPEITRRDLSSVRLVQSSAGGTSRQMIRDVHRWFPRARLNYGWGQTESGLGTSLVLTAEMAADDLARAGSIGRPMPFLEIKVVDDDGAEVPAGTVGEGVVRSAATMRGYFRMPEATAEALTPEGWLRTGDMMVKDAEGYVYLRSRKRDLVKSGGENVFVAEVESVLAEHPAVADCVVFGMPDPALGEAVAVAVQLTPGHRVTLAELQHFSRARLAGFKKPRHLEILDSLGRNEAGKVDKPGIVRRCEEAAALRVTPGAPETAEVAPGVVRVTVPHRGGLEGSTSCYVILGERALVVDPGADSPEGLGTLVRALAELGVDRRALDVLITHEHADHGGLARVVGSAGRVMASRGAVDHLARLAAGTDQDRVRRRFTAEGFDPADAERFAAMVAGASPAPGPAVHPVTDGTVLTVGDRRWTVLTTPGHTPGHLVLHDPVGGVLLTGDHLLFHVTPPVTYTGDDRALADHLAGLERVAALGATTVLPAHGPLGGAGDAAHRARALVEHHEARLAAAVDLVGRGVTTGAALTRLLPRSVPGPWEELDAGLRWLTAGHALVCLDLLVGRGDLVREQRGRLDHYVVNPGHRRTTEG